MVIHAPHDKREGHVAVCVDDLPYQELREEYMPKINKERLRWDSVFRKFYNMRIAKKSHKVRQDGLAMKARAVALDLQRAIDESGLKISELVESRSFRKLSALLALIIRISLVLTLSEEKTIPTFMLFIIQHLWRYLTMYSMRQCLLCFIQNVCQRHIG